MTATIRECLYTGIQVCVVVKSGFTFGADFIDTVGEKHTHTAAVASSRTALKEPLVNMQTANRTALSCPPHPGSVPEPRCFKVMVHQGPQRIQSEIDCLTIIVLMGGGTSCHAVWRVCLSTGSQGGRSDGRRLRMSNLRNEESEECPICEGDNLKSAALAFFGQEIRASRAVSAACARVFLQTCSRNPTRA